MVRKTLALPLLLSGIVLLVAAPLGVLLPTWANQPSPPHALFFPMHPAVADVWRVTDGPIVESRVQRAWLWGPAAIAMAVEYDAESPTGLRQMIYFEKGRLDVYDPTAPADSPWSIVGGLLVSEMVSGTVHFGRDVSVPREPARIALAGDLDQPDPVTYASLAAVRSRGEPSGLLGASQLLTAASAPAVPARVGSPITVLLRPDGSIAPAGPGVATVRIGGYNDVTGHNVAAPFVDWEAAQPFPHTWLLGHPISEPYWIDTVVLGTPKRILVQAFERRVLTYTPDNPPAWQVESTNVGSHYRAWRGLSQPADATLTGLASLEPSGEEIVAAATAAGVDPYLLVAIAKVVSGGNPLATGGVGGYGLMGVRASHEGAAPADPFANAVAAAQSLAERATGDPRVWLAAYFQPENPDLGDPNLAQIVDLTLATAERLRDRYAPWSAEEAMTIPFATTGHAYRWPSDFDRSWWENSLGWYGSWGGAVAGWRFDPLGYYCAHPDYAPGSRLRLVANGVTLDCTIGATIPDAALIGWGDGRVIEVNDAAYAALHLDAGNEVMVSAVLETAEQRATSAFHPAGVRIGAGLAAHYAPSYDRAWWEWAMHYYSDKGVITPNWSLDPQGMYCVHPNYLPGDRLRLVANGVIIDCTVGDMVADQDVYRWRQRFAVEVSWDTFVALGLQEQNWVEVYYLGPAPKPERYGEPPDKVWPDDPASTPEPTTDPTATPTPEPTSASEPTAEPTENAPVEPTASPTEETLAEPTAAATSAG